MGHLHVTPEELTATAQRLDGEVTALGTLRSQAHDCTVPAGAFGRIPGVGPHIDSVYTRHVSDSVELVQQATDGLDNSVKSLQATALAFTRLEQALAHGISRSAPHA